MEQKILDFLTKHRVCSLTTLLSDGSPHAAALHYSHRDNPLTLYFSTENTSRKCQDLLNGKTGKATVAIGFSEEEWVTFQMDGDIRMATKEELPEIQKVHYTKHPDAAKYKDDPATVFLIFTPTWWRYTDYKTKPPTIVSSEA